MKKIFVIVLFILLIVSSISSQNQQRIANEILQLEELLKIKKDSLEMIKELQKKQMLSTLMNYPKDVHGVIAIKSVEVKNNPSYTSFRIIKELPKGTIIKVIGHEEGHYWIETDDAKGYVIDSYILNSDSLLRYKEQLEIFKQQMIIEEQKKEELRKKKEKLREKKEKEQQISLWIKESNEKIEFKKELEKELEKKRERERQEEYTKRKNVLISRYGIEIGNRILNKSIWIGMTKEMARDSWGEPEHINRSVGSWGVHEQWVYYKTYLYFEDGILTSWQD